MTGSQAAKPIIHRGDILNNPTLTHKISSPIDDVLLVSSTHWKAQKSITSGPHFELFPSGQAKHTEKVSTSKDAASLSFKVGEVSATVSTEPRAFNVDFRAGKKLLTQLGWRSIGYVKEGTTALHPKANYTDPNKGKRWMTYQLKLAVGDKVFGLGERFGPFQKNGQVSTYPYSTIALLNIAVDGRDVERRRRNRVGVDLQEYPLLFDICRIRSFYPKPFIHLLRDTV